MGTLLKLEPQDAVAYIACVALGYFTGRIFTDPATSTYLSLLVSYHLFLIWLVFTAEQRAGFSLPIVSTVLTHLACTVVVLLFSAGRVMIPFFGIVRYGVPSLAIFERGWLFAASPKPETGEDGVPVMSPVVAAASPEDYEAWLVHLAHRKPDPRYMRTPLRTQYEEFLLDRARRRNAHSIWSNTKKAA